MKATDLAKVRSTLWAAADELRANSKLTPVQYRDPVLGLVFLAYAENRFEAVRGEVEAKASARNPPRVADYKAKVRALCPGRVARSHVGLPEPRRMLERILAASDVCPVQSQISSVPNSC